MDDGEFIPMKVAEAFGKWFPGMVAGFTASQAKEIAAKGLAEYVNPVDGGSEQPTTTADIVAIHQDWEQQHHIKIMALAKRIAGDAVPNPLTLEVAKTIITDELALRGAKGE